MKTQGKRAEFCGRRVEVIDFPRPGVAIVRWPSDHENTYEIRAVRQKPALCVVTRLENAAA